MNIAAHWQCHTFVFGQLNKHSHFLYCKEPIINDQLYLHCSCNTCTAAHKRLSILSPGRLNICFSEQCYIAAHWQCYIAARWQLSTFVHSQLSIAAHSLKKYIFKLSDPKDKLHQIFSDLLPVLHCCSLTVVHFLSLTVEHSLDKTNIQKFKLFLSPKYRN